MAPKKNENHVMQTPAPPDSETPGKGCNVPMPHLVLLESLMV